MSTPSLHPPRLEAPPSKSVTHRAFFLAAFSRRPCVVRSPSLAADTRSTLDVLSGLGARFDITSAGDVAFEPFTPYPPTAPLDCGNSGTTLRLACAQVARFGFAATLTGDDSLIRRPNGPLLKALSELGAEVRSNSGMAPVTLRGPIHAGDVTLATGLSSQFGSSLLLVLPLLSGASSIGLKAPVASRPYLDLTLEVARDFGLHFEPDEDAEMLRYRVRGSQLPEASEHTVEGDWSATAFLLVAAAVTGGEAVIAGLRAESAQGDRAIVDLIRAFGVEAQWRSEELVVRPGGTLASPGEIDVGPIPDLFPPLCALAAVSRGSTRLRGSPGLRCKESDRIKAMVEGLAAMGIEVSELPDGLTITGGEPRGAAIRSRGDHRIHMAFSVLGLVASGGTQVDNPTCVTVSYPDFHRDLAMLA